MAYHLPAMPIWSVHDPDAMAVLFRESLTAGTSRFSACEEAASVVTARRDMGTPVVHLLMDAARRALRAVLNMTNFDWCGEKNSGKGREWKREGGSEMVMINEDPPMRINS